MCANLAKKVFHILLAKILLALFPEIDVAVAILHDLSTSLNGGMLDCTFAHLLHFLMPLESRSASCAIWDLFDLKKAKKDLDFYFKVARFANHNYSNKAP